MMPNRTTPLPFLAAPAAALIVAACSSAPIPTPFTIREAPVDFTQVGDTIPPAPDIEAMIAPYRDQLEEQLDVVLGHAAGEFTKADPEGTLDNLVAEALLHAARARSSDTVHASLVNEGGLRVPLAAGPILMRHAYELLPFENFVVVLSLTGAQMEELADQIAATTGEPIAGWTMELDGRDAVGVRVGGEPVDRDRTYRLATVDYLVNGGGAWSVLWEVEVGAREDLDILIRSAFVEYLDEMGTVTPVLDGRIRSAGGAERETTLPRRSMRQSRATSSPALALCGALLAPSAAPGQETVRRVSLAEALEAFAGNSLELKIARSETAGSMGMARQSRAYFNPEFSFERDDLSHNDEKVWEESFLLQQQVEWPGRTTARARAAGHAIRAGAARFRADSIALAFEVRESYVRAWFAEEAESIVRRTASVIQSVVEDAEVRLEAGDISAFEARRLRLARAEADQELAEAVLRTRGARRNLGLLIAPGTATQEVGPSEGPDGVPPMIGREAAMAALDGRPDVEAAASELDAARAGVDVAATYWVPVPNLGLGYRHYDDGFGGASLGLDLALPVFDRGAGTREEAAAHSSAAAYRLELRRQLARNDVLAASDRYASSRARLEAAAQGLRADGEALLASATAAYAEHEMTLLELLDAASAFQGAQLSALSLETEAWVSYYDLLRATGSAPEDER